MQVTQLLDQARAGDGRARDLLLKVTYDELRRLADGFLRRERSGHTLDATALVHEACVRLLEQENLPGHNRAQFLSYLARSMRHILVSHARSRGRIKRGGGMARVPLEHQVAVDGGIRADLLDLDEALDRLADVHERKAKVVELRYFGGLTGTETAEALDVSVATVERDWNVARLWLLRELRKGGVDDE